MFRWLIRPFWREPDERIGGDENPYLLRWHVIPHNKWMNVYLHAFLRSDDDRWEHFHPWHSLSVMLRGRYIEVHNCKPTEYRAGSVVARAPSWCHKILIPEGERCWTLFITGPHCAEWGYKTVDGFVHWREIDGRM